MKEVGNGALDTIVTIKRKRLLKVCARDQNDNPKKGKEVRANVVIQ